MPRKLNVWGGNMRLSRFKPGCQFKAGARIIMAGTKRDFMARTGISSDFCAATANDIELQVALAEPSTIFWSEERIHDFHRSDL